MLGGIRSGKSRWAESAIAEAVGPSEPVCYVATGPTADPDPLWSARVADHRARRPAHWSTTETRDVANQLQTNAATATLIDDVGGWLTGVLDRRNGWTGGSVVEDIDEFLCAVQGFSAPLVAVSPEVGLTVVPATASGRLFADELGRLNQRLADICERVVLVVAGQPVSVKVTDDGR